MTRYGKHEVAGQLAQESGDHASARWARKQQLSASKKALQEGADEFMKAVAKELEQQREEGSQ